MAWARSARKRGQGTGSEGIAAVLQQNQMMMMTMLMQQNNNSSNTVQHKPPLPQPPNGALQNQAWIVDSQFKCPKFQTIIEAGTTLQQVIEKLYTHPLTHKEYIGCLQQGTELRVWAPLDHLKAVFPSLEDDFPEFDEGRCQRCTSRSHRLVSCSEVNA